MSRTRRGPITSLLLLSPILIGSLWIAYKDYSVLPQPLEEPFDPVTNLPQISERNILGISKYLSEDIGFRTPGTLEHALGDEWFYQQVLHMQQECERVAKESGRNLECEIWRQQGSGSHRFDMMGSRLYKTYVSLTNIIVRISNGTPEGKEHAVLVNSHLDSTLPTPGAADDALSVGVMLECFRVLVNTPHWSPKHAIILLWNNAEESLQDGSHLFSTQHPVAPSIRAVINLEAAGTTGKELLFQASSEQMIEAYSHVPHPHGTVIANDIFSSGIILSDTDFRQFQEYLNVTGLDMAVVGNSYLYHMRKDLVENIQPGVAQNMAENTLALLQYLSSSDSPLVSLTEGYKKPTTVYLNILGYFFIYSFATAKVLYGLLLAASVVLLRSIFVSPTKKGSPQKQLGTLEAIREGFVSSGLGLLGSFIAPNLVAVVMTRVLHKDMSWYANEYSTMLLYGPPAALGALLPQFLLGSVNEVAVYSSILLIQAAGAFFIQLLGIGSAGLLYLTGNSLFGALLLNPFFAGSKRELSLWTYTIGQSIPLLVASMCAFPTLDVFVPLAGRIGIATPTDHLMATIVSGLGTIGFPLFLPFVHRFGRKFLVRSTFAASVATAIAIAVFAARDPFDDMHQKRVYILRTENITTGEHHLHISTSDAAPGFPELVHEIAKEFGGPREVLENGEIAVVVPEALVMDKYNPDWDPMYPFSLFLSPYKIPLSVDSSYISPWSLPETKFHLTAVDDVIDIDAGTRSLKLEVYHPGLIWTVIAFDAHVLKWSLDDSPPDEYVRHHVKEASFYGSDTWSIDLVVKLPPNVTAASDGGLLINFIGLQEKGMWPGKKAVWEQESEQVKANNLAMSLFQRLDAWVEQKTEGKVDALLLGCVAGIERV
ncbi:endoplasmic reticulum metallopeptidase 1 [Moniliophthora roreri MCA 2997]|uniref:Peptide hydrolase n=1 Tax=Moniliophthora roreri (strain MCA 2997) TaxID=1381753 RepID=V2XVA4_MONRO|nr:endoplasmic reticulum metallopeptidase 1 [Moniliophthora roreri MCA 2997]